MCKDTHGSFNGSETLAQAIQRHFPPLAAEVLALMSRFHPSFRFPRLIPQFQSSVKSTNASKSTDWSTKNHAPNLALALIVKQFSPMFDSRASQMV